MFKQFWDSLGLATMASVVMSPVHCLFGLHIVRRGVIFIDLAVAQLAALGTIVAMNSGREPHDPASYWFSLGFAMIGALLISLTKFKLGRVPHEAMIGIFFVVASALGILLLAESPHGSEELKDVLGGNILLVEQSMVERTAMVYAGILAALFVFWRPIAAISLKRDGAPTGAKAVAFDFLFYALLAVVVAYSVQIVGVLVVFTWLVMPAVCAFFWLEKMGAAIATALPLSVIGSLAGLWLSFKGDYPTGAAIVVVFGILVAIAYLPRLFVSSPEPAEL